MTKSVQQSMEEQIRQRRSQMLIHSYLYYELDTTLIDDNQWQKWANELRDLHDAMLHLKDHHNIRFYDKEFIGWDGSTGYHLPKDSWVREKAQRLLKYKEKHG